MPNDFMIVSDKNAERLQWVGGLKRAAASALREDPEQEYTRLFRDAKRIHCFMVHVADSGPFRIIKLRVRARGGAWRLKT
jgi:hypothetical protein